MIPRYTDDIEDLRAGIRWIFSKKSQVLGLMLLPIKKAYYREIRLDLECRTGVSPVFTTHSRDGCATLFCDNRKRLTE
jgi:hypothetical protein